ncbi:hypothetical protein F2Q69_00036333 [Brassica cretica]|uniref:Uncharacterized protein n=1 Tax=Brassica cretica TaxID=69181 RepID=A0A8S9SKI2_BRACR|nr:hypothetical protein F2Q69_00036333 [Brassica cretica]
MGSIATVTLVSIKKYSGIEFLQTPGRTPASGSPLGGTPVPRYEVLRVRSLRPPPPPGKRKTSDKENLPYFRIWKSLTYFNRLRPAIRRLYKGNLNLKEGSNLNYVIMAVGELPEATQREAELHRKIDGLQRQFTEFHKTREEANPELSSEFQSLKEKLDEHSKQLEQSAEMLSLLESENLNLRDENQALNTASNKKRRFRTQVRPMPTLETPKSGTGVNLPPTASGGGGSTREKAKDAQTYDVEDSESEPKPDKEAPDGATKAESPMVAYLEQMFSKRLDVITRPSG